MKICACLLKASPFIHCSSQCSFVHWQYFCLAALALLSCNVSATSLHAVDHVLEIIGNTVTFVTTRLKGTSPTQVRDYLERENLPRICLLLVDADEVNRASLLEELEYKDLFKTVLDRVGKLSWRNSWGYS